MVSVYTLAQGSGSLAGKGIKSRVSIFNRDNIIAHHCKSAMQT